MEQKQWHLRKAQLSDETAIWSLIERSVRVLQASDYSKAQLDVAIGTVYGVDRAVIGDGCYFVIEAVGEHEGRIVGSGGWSRRATLFGVHQEVRDDSFLQPGQDAARIRAFFIDPDWARQGLASAIYQACEDAALAAGFTRLALAATLTGIPFYRRVGFRDGDYFLTPLTDGGSILFMNMEKDLTIDNGLIHDQPQQN